MAMTAKQQRNGVPGPDATGGVSQPGPDATGDIRSAKAAAEAAGNARKVETLDSLLNTPAGSGVSGHSVGGGGSMFDWDSALAVNEPAGEA